MQCVWGGVQLERREAHQLGAQSSCVLLLRCQVGRQVGGVRARVAELLEVRGLVRCGAVVHGVLKLECQPFDQRAELHRHMLAQPSQHSEARARALLGGRGLCRVLQRGGQPQLEPHEWRSERLELVRGRRDRGEELAPRRAGRLLRLDPKELLRPLLLLLQPLLVLLQLLFAQRIERHHRAARRDHALPLRLPTRSHAQSGFGIQLSTARLERAPNTERAFCPGATGSMNARRLRPGRELGQGEDALHCAPLGTTKNVTTTGVLLVVKIMRLRDAERTQSAERRRPRAAAGGPACSAIASHCNICFGRAPALALVPPDVAVGALDRVRGGAGLTRPA